MASASVASFSIWSYRFHKQTDQIESTGCLSDSRRGGELLDEGLGARMECGALAPHECDLARESGYIDRLGAHVGLGFELHGARRQYGDSKSCLYQGDSGGHVVDFARGQ